MRITRLNLSNLNLVGPIMLSRNSSVLPSLKYGLPGVVDFSIAGNPGLFGNIGDVGGPFYDIR